MDGMTMVGKEREDEESGEMKKMKKMKKKFID